MGGECHNCIQVMAKSAGHSGTQPTTKSAIMVQEPWPLTLGTFTSSELTKCSSSTIAILDLIKYTLKVYCFLDDISTTNTWQVIQSSMKDSLQDTYLATLKSIHNHKSTWKNLSNPKSEPHRMVLNMFTMQKCLSIRTMFDWCFALWDSTRHWWHHFHLCFNI